MHGVTGGEGGRREEEVACTDFYHCVSVSHLSLSAKARAGDMAQAAKIASLYDLTSLDTPW